MRFIVRFIDENVMPKFGFVVRHPLYHFLWLCVYIILAVAALFNPVLANAVALVFAISIETAIAIHAGA